MTVSFMSFFRSLSNEIPTTLPRRFFGDFLYVFDTVLVFSFLFSRLNSQRAIKMYSSKGIILLWSAILFFCDINRIRFSCDGITA